MLILLLHQLWDTERPDGTISLVHSSSMRQFNWGYTQFSQFNSDDTLLLVSGVYLGPQHSSSGEIAVISLGDTHSLLSCWITKLFNCEILVTTKP